VVSEIVRAVEAVGAGIIVVGGFGSFVVFAWQVRFPATAPGSYHGPRRNLCRCILLGLEALIVAEIVRTIIVDPTIESVAVLGIIVVIRILLSFALEVEMDGIWPWRRWQLLSVVLVHWDESDPVDLTRSISFSSASAALSALGSGMLVFTGFVTSVVLMAVQFGTSEFSPRFVAWFRRDRTLKFALSTFTATFVFALVSTAQVGRGNGAFVPTRTLIAALLLTLLSIAMFLLLINLTSNGLRVASVLQKVDGEARRVFDAVYPAASASDAAAAEETATSLDDLTPVQTVLQDLVGSVVVALNRAGIVRLAEQYDAVIELVPAIGDHVPAGGALFNVYGSRRLPEQRLRRGLVLGDERTLDDDPAFAIRMVVDVAIKALSPAVNDPTTAVQSLDRIEDLLRYAASKQLSVGIVHGATAKPGSCIRPRAGRISSSSDWTRSAPSAPGSTRSSGGYACCSTPCSPISPSHDVSPSSSSANCSTTPSQSPFPRASAPPPSCQTAKGSECHAARPPTGTDDSGEPRDQSAHDQVHADSCEGVDSEGVPVPIQPGVKARCPLRRSPRLGPAAVFSRGATIGWVRRYQAADGQLFAVLLSAYLLLTLLPCSSSPRATLRRSSSGSS